MAGTFARGAGFGAGFAVAVSHASLRRERSSRLIFFFFSVMRVERCSECNSVEWTILLLISHFQQHCGPPMLLFCWNDGMLCLQTISKKITLPMK